MKSSENLFKERCKAIIFRAFSISSVALDVISIVKKYYRGHHTYWIIASIFLAISAYFGSYYSLLADYYCVNGNTDYEPVKKWKKRRPIPVRDRGTSKIDQFINLSDEADEISSDSTEPIADSTVTVKFLTPIKEYKEPELQIAPKTGTKVVPSFDGTLETADETEKGESFISITKKMLFTPSRITLLIHCLSAPKCFRFIRSSKKLLEYLKEGFNERSSSELQEKGVKKVCYNKKYRDYCNEELISKQVSLLIASCENIPMLLLDLAYWSKYGKGLSSFNNDIASSSYNYIELAAIIVNIVKLAYFLISLQNQIRRLDIRRQDLKFFARHLPCFGASPLYLVPLICIPCCYFTPLPRSCRFSGNKAIPASHLLFILPRPSAKPNHPSSDVCYTDAIYVRTRKQRTLHLVHNS